MNYDDRRTSPRFPLRAFAEIANSHKEWAAHILDISYQGARLALLDEYQLCAGDCVNLRIEVPETQATDGLLPYIYLKGTVVHQQEHMLGIKYEPASEEDTELLTKLLLHLNTPV